MENYENIANSSRLISVFGYWPSFHDAEVVWVRLDRRATSLGDGPTVEVLIHTFEMTSEIDAAGFYVLRKHVLVQLRFSKVMEPVLESFNHQNVLNGLDIREISSQQARSRSFAVTLDTSYGINAAFECQNIEVVDVQPCDSEGVPLSGAMNGENSTNDSCGRP